MSFLGGIAMYVHVQVGLHVSNFGQPVGTRCVLT